MTTALAPFHPHTRAWFESTFAGADRRADAQLAGDRGRAPRVDHRPDGQRQDADGVSMGVGCVRERTLRIRRNSGAVHLTAQGVEQRHSAQPARTAGRVAGALRRGRRSVSVDPRSGALRRHFVRGSPADAAPAAGDPDHHTRKPDVDADERARPRGSGHGADGDPRRDPLRGRKPARHGADDIVGAPRPRRRRVSAHRAVCHRQPAH